MATREDNFLRAIADGAATWVIGMRIGWDTASANRALRRMEGAGLVHRSPRSAVNNIIWLPGPAHSSSGRHGT